MSKFSSQLADYASALIAFEEALRQEKNEFIRDSAIKRFELVFDVGWKALKTFLEEQHTVICNSPRSCFKEAFVQGIIEYDDFWIEVTNLRNDAVHAYSELLAEKIYAGLPRVLTYFQTLYKQLGKIDQK